MAATASPTGMFGTCRSQPLMHYPSIDSRDPMNSGDTMEFGSANSFSGEQAHIVSPILHDKSFSWSDFPVVGYSADEENDIVPHQSQETKVYNYCSSDHTSQHYSTGKRLRSEDEPSRGGVKKSVSFKSVMIREHKVIVTYHPSSESRLPMSLDWEHSPACTVLDVGDYEDSRMGHRRSISEMHLSYYQRKNVLKRASGLTESDVIRAERQVLVERQKAEDELHRSNNSMEDDDGDECCGKVVEDEVVTMSLHHVETHSGMEQLW
eukprot:CAMPEP_0198294690 /NCGR_PEP_ID=MMETSP1449-20131203/23694_1 /TAXON_ID=420275 /ORGANISM="Attheya septentrionalis, Strain CCMP2084" /LENGTH=264 /DNA_ID=CAMNT_0043994715 /DNA_START=84 /DNA_END=875 /DNA_ORIENTATION=+